MARRLGQHFLFDPSILGRIVDALDPHPTDVVIEIGPGKGTLTRLLLERVGFVRAIEKDRVLAAGVRNTLGGPALQVIPEDALAVDWVAGLDGPVKLVGNIPYRITSSLIDRALNYPAVTRVVFLVQSEVADRIAANPGTRSYGALTVGVAAVARAERLFTIKAGAFRPPPRVQSAAVRLSPREKPLVPHDQLPAFRRFVVALFGQRRKQLRSSLRVALGVSAARALELLEAAEIEPDLRVEVLSPERIFTLFQQIGD